MAAVAAEAEAEHARDNAGDRSAGACDAGAEDAPVDRHSSFHWSVCPVAEGDGGAEATAWESIKALVRALHSAMEQVVC